MGTCQISLQNAVFNRQEAFLLLVVPKWYGTESQLKGESHRMRYGSFHVLEQCVKLNSHAMKNGYSTLFTVEINL